MALLQAHHGLQGGSDNFDSLFILRFTACEKTVLTSASCLHGAELLCVLKLNCRSADSIKKQYQCAGSAYNEHTCSTHKESCCTCSSVSLAAAVFLTCALLCVENYICFPLYTHQFKKAAICCFFNLHNESVLMPPIYCLGSQQNN